MVRKKSSYLLLELLISITLLTLCAIPLLSSHPRLIASQMRFLQKVEHERVANWAVTEIIEVLEGQKIPWSQIPPLGKEGNLFSLGERPLNFLLKAVNVRYSFHTLKEKIDPNANTYRLLAVKICVGQDVFRFRIIVAHASVKSET